MIPVFSPQSPHRGVQVRLTLVDAAAGQLPPHAELGRVILVRMEQQDPILAVADDEPHGVALEDRQVSGELDHRGGRGWSRSRQNQEVLRA